MIRSPSSPHRQPPTRLRRTDFVRQVLDLLKIDSDQRAEIGEDSNEFIADQRVLFLVYTGDLSARAAPRAT